jgi:hypothetical protein
MTDENDEIKQLNELKEMGILSQEEYDDKLRLINLIKTNPEEAKKEQERREEEEKIAIRRKKNVKVEEKYDENEILEWVNSIEINYTEKKVTNFESDLESGMVLVHIIHYKAPKIINLKKFEEDNSEENLILSFAILNRFGFDISPAKESEFGKNKEKTVKFMGKLKKHFENLKFKEDEDTKDIINKIKENTYKYNEVNFSDKNLSERQIKELLQSLEKNTIVKILLLSKTNLNDNSCRLLSSLVRNNTTITTYFNK